MAKRTTKWNVYLGNKLIDSVFGYETYTADEVRKSLVNHDGYDSGIRVVKARKSKGDLVGRPNALGWIAGRTEKGVATGILVEKDLEGAFIRVAGKRVVLPKGERIYPTLVEAERAAKGLGRKTFGSHRKERLYRLIWVRDDKKTRGVLAPGPFTHAEAVTALSKFTRHRWRRDLLEEIR